jgi:glycogen debranching enzyme
MLIPLRLAIGSDFADIFEVRGMHRDARGRRLNDQVSDNEVIFTYEGLDGVVRKTRIHCNPAPQEITSSEVSYELLLQPREEMKLHCTISCDTTDSEHLLSFAEARAAAAGELRDVNLRKCRIRSTNDRFNRWVKRSAADVEMMILGNPEAHYPYAGVPWFSTVFGRDGIITALEMLWVDPSIARGVLEFLGETQATENIPEKEAQPGKILHEMRGGEMATVGEVPFGRYYGTVDATPLFIMLASAYYERTGDLSFIREMWPHILLALEWIDVYGDADGDGFVEYSKHSRKGLVQQGWKDSNDSIFHADGTLADPPIALCEVQGYVYAAKLAASKLSLALGDRQHSSRLEAEAKRLRTKFEEAFWCEDISTYALALDGQKQPCRVRASNAGHCLYTGIASFERGRQVAQGLIGPEFFTGWGIRTLAGGEARYNPLSYHNGSVWPHDNAILASGMARYGFRDLAGQILLSQLDVSSMVELHRLPELFCGLKRRQGEGPTLYPVACSPQAWAAGAAFMMLQACLGITVDGLQRRVVLDHPYLPEGVPQLRIAPLHLDGASLSLQVTRHAHTVQVHVLEQSGDIELVLR